MVVVVAATAGLLLAAAPSTASAQGLPRRVFELAAKKSWRPGSDKQDLVASGDILAGTQKSQTQCYSGNEKYLRRAVLCDRMCMADAAAVARASGQPSDFRDSAEFCNGPWYCSRTEICEMYRSQGNDGRETAIQRPCTVVYGCANHTQCFPSEDDQRRMNVALNDGDWTDEDAVERIRDDGFTMYYGGFKVTTTCCVNNDGPQTGYRLSVDQPCNAASAHGSPRGALVVVGVATAWGAWWWASLFAVAAAGPRRRRRGGYDT